MNWQEWFQRKGKVKMKLENRFNTKTQKSYICKYFLQNIEKVILKKTDMLSTSKSFWAILLDSSS